jgi:peptidoglycan-N-acetylglucosamine deacetylase
MFAVSRSVSTACKSLNLRRTRPVSAYEIGSAPAQPEQAPAVEPGPRLPSIAIDLVMLAVVIICGASAFAADTPKSAKPAVPAPVAGQKLVALTFDDGPRPYVLYGKVAGDRGLLDVLDKNKVKATFFYMGWRLTPKTWGERHEVNIGKTCLDAAADVFKRGHEIENHTYSHLDAKTATRQHGEQWYVDDVDKASAAIKQVTGANPHYVRPPEWVMWPELRSKIENRGYKIMTIYASDPVMVRDINSADYLCAGSAKQCPKPGLEQFVINQIDAREKKGVHDHVLVFHELTSSLPALEQLIPELQKRGYKFVTLSEYMKAVAQ